jgi:hypothetical protein
MPVNQHHVYLHEALRALDEAGMPALSGLFHGRLSAIKEMEASYSQQTLALLKDVERALSLNAGLVAKHMRPCHKKRLLAGESVNVMYR